mgnify:CR=1 FL=1
MIVVEYGEYWELIKQHDHALLAGEMASYAGNPPFAPSTYRTIATAALHDASWRESDEKFHDNPYPFANYPISQKLKLYKKGIDLMEQIDEYIALLTSLHYTAFFQPNGTDEIRQFLLGEKRRQEKLRAKFPDENIELAHQQLQMWDNFSLYVCLNKPGVQKENEHPWFKNGIRAVDASGKPIIVEARWLDGQTVAFSPFPFVKTWTATIPYMIYDKKTGHIQNKTRKITFLAT